MSALWWIDNLYKLFSALVHCQLGLAPAPRDPAKQRQLLQIMKRNEMAKLQSNRCPDLPRDFEFCTCLMDAMMGCSPCCSQQEGMHLPSMTPALITSQHLGNWCVRKLKICLYKDSIKFVFTALLAMKKETQKAGKALFYTKRWRQSTRLLQ